MARNLYLVASNGNDTFGEVVRSNLQADTAEEFHERVSELCGEYAWQVMAAEPHRSDWNLFTMTIHDERGQGIASAPFPQTHEPDLLGNQRAILQAIRGR